MPALASAAARGEGGSDADLAVVSDVLEACVSADACDSPAADSPPFLGSCLLTISCEPELLTGARGL